MSELAKGLVRQGPVSSELGVLDAALHRNALNNALLFAKNKHAHANLEAEVRVCRSMLKAGTTCGVHQYEAIRLFIGVSEWPQNPVTRNLFTEYVRHGLVKLDEPINVQHGLGRASTSYPNLSLPLEAAVQAQNLGVFFALLEEGADHRLVPGPFYSKHSDVTDVFDLITKRLPSQVSPAITARLNAFLMERRLRELVPMDEERAQPAPRRRTRSV